MGVRTDETMDRQTLSLSVSCAHVTQKLKKFLVSIDYRLLQYDHIHEIQSNIIRHCGMIYHVRNALTIQALTQIYNSLIFPQLIYCHVVWGAVPVNGTNSLIITQKKVIRNIEYLKKYKHTRNICFNHCSYALYSRTFILLRLYSFIFFFDIMPVSY